MAVAQSVLVNFDESGNGTITIPGAPPTVLPLTCSIQPDPSSAGNPGVLFCGIPLPPGVSLTGGDLLVFEQNSNVLIFDVVRFATITLGGVPVSGAFIYSDNTDGVDAVADTPGPPFPVLPNQATVTEVGTEGQNTATYTPGTGQPGFLANPAGSIPPVTYTFTSDQPPPGRHLPTHRCNY
jgi:hypothetical protein